MKTDAVFNAAMSGPIRMDVISPGRVWDNFMMIACVLPDRDRQAYVDWIKTAGRELNRYGRTVTYTFGGDLDLDTARRIVVLATLAGLSSPATEAMEMYVEREISR